MSTPRKPTNGKGAHKGRAKPWIPTKFQDEAARLIEEARDPWTDCRHPLISPQWGNPRQFWSTVLAYLHWRENKKLLPWPHYNRNDTAKTFWEALQSCEALTALWDHRPVEEVHAFILAAHTVHWRELTSRERVKVGPSPTPGAIRKRERRYWRWWSKWLEETEAGLQAIDNRLINTEDCQRILKVMSSAKGQAATWAKTPPPQEIRYTLDLTGLGGTTRTFVMKSNTTPSKGRPDGGDLPEAINGELAMLDTVARPVFGGRNYPKTFAAIVRHFLPSDGSVAASYSDVLRVRIHRVRRTRAADVSLLEAGVRSALQKLKADPLASELA